MTGTAQMERPTTSSTEQPTRSSQLEPPMTKDEGWTQVTAPEMHQWKTKGETIAGVLVSASSVELKGKKVLQYILATDETHRIKMLATYDLLQKLGRSHIGMQVRIKYLGEDDSIRRGDNSMKVFDVQVRRNPDAPVGRDSGPISDEDIPF